MHKTILHETMADASHEQRDAHTHHIHHSGEHEHSGDHADRRAIVIAMDESPQAHYALNFYMEHVHKPSDRIVMVHCPEYHAMMQSPAIPSDATVLAGLMLEEERRVKKLLEGLGDKLREMHVGGKVKSMGGKPGEAIIQAAKDECATMIVTGTRGMGTIRRTLLGSVSDYILHHSHVPVLICRHKEDVHSEGVAHQH